MGNCQTPLFCISITQNEQTNAGTFALLAMHSGTKFDVNISLSTNGLRCICLLVFVQFA